MGIEIERKFLLAGDSWRDIFTKKINLRQGYLSCSENCTIRVRVSDSNAWITVKGANVNITRSEFEYPIPREDADKMLQEFAANNVIQKIRYFIEYQGTEWVVDEFFGNNHGLILAEVELETENSEYKVPAWIGKDVSEDYRYCNSNLARHPYSQW